ncbi:MAG: DUF2807 domain-containing protein [Candidatus Marinimicrobia bacterium]|nr:DUF2807 domain-containing protein [Candidatus Neomarinimicrobiota bacterium]
MKLTNKILLATFGLILIAIFILLIIIRIQIKDEFSIIDGNGISHIILSNKELHLANFKSIRILIPSSVSVINSKNNSIDISGSETELNNLKINISDNNLVISSKKNILDFKEKLFIKLSLSHIEKIEVSCPSCINIKNFSLKSLEILIGEAGKIKGTNNYIKNLKITSKIAGNIDFKNCHIVNAVLNLNGKNRVEINMAGGVLRGHVDGSSIITYYGNIKEHKLVSLGLVYIIDGSNRLKKT